MVLILPLKLHINKMLFGLHSVDNISDSLCCNFLEHVPHSNGEVSQVPAVQSNARCPVAELIQRHGNGTEVGNSAFQNVVRVDQTEKT